MNSGAIATNMASPGQYVHASEGPILKSSSAQAPIPPPPTSPQTLRKIIVFLAFVCLILDLFIGFTRPDGDRPLGHIIGTFLPDILAFIMFTKYVRSGLGRYPPRTRITLFTLLLTAGLMWPMVSFVYAGTIYRFDGQIWSAYGLNRFIVFFCTLEYQRYVTSIMATFIHLVRSRDLVCLLYLLLAGIELFRSLRLFRTTAANAENADKKGALGEVEDGEEIEMAPPDQKADEDRDFKNEVEVDVVGE
ncbi:hypothetical protein BGZ93_006534 [Podila epicladia]|nr:hypothetical protein BGZ92_006349 [Podila epicladia]KAG0094937.1 hypothetical protein BGZ93_006534 [Podila epicladia]